MIELRRLPHHIGFAKWINLPYPEGQIVFILNGKCGNTSVKQAILEAQGVTGARPHRVSPNWSRLRTRFSGYQKIAIVRNPYARAVSMWHQKVVQKKTSRLLRRGAFRADMSFLEFMRMAVTLDAHHDLHLRPQWMALTHLGRTLPDHVFQIEDGQMWDKVRQISGPLPDLPHGNSSGAPDWRELCQGEAQDLVVRRYRRDFEVCGYPTEIA
ncbi:MAG: sulfotransferase family 2 domain-containing protein [Pseudomonadota bacterium]